MAYCAARLQDGTRCTRTALLGWKVCRRHEHCEPQDWPAETPATEDHARFAEVEKRVRARRALARKVIAGKAHGLELARHQYLEASNLCSDIERACSLTGGNDAGWLRLLTVGYDGVRSAARLVVEAEATLRAGDTTAEKPKLEVVWTDATSTTTGNSVAPAAAVAAG